MSGLGDALGQVGGMLMGIGKQKMLEKLEDEREAKRKQDEIAKEERAAARAAKKVKDTRVIQRDGNYVNQYLNDEGAVLKEEAADPYAVSQIANAQQKDKLTLESLVVANEAKQRDLKYYDEDRALERRYKEASIRNLDEPNSRAGGLGSRMGDASETPSPSQMGIELAKAFPDLRKMYTEGEEPLLTAEEYQHLAQGAVLEAAATKKDAITLFRAALRGRAAQNKAKKAKEE